MKCCVDVVTACDGEALECGYCADHHPHLGFCPEAMTALDETIDGAGPRVLEALRRKRGGGS